MKKNQNYEINFATKTITVTKKFLQDASQMGTDAFTEMIKLQELGMPIAVQEIHRKPKVAKWTYERMESFLNNVDTSKYDWMADYEALKESVSHAEVWAWFKLNFVRVDKNGKRITPTLNKEHKILPFSQGNAPKGTKKHASEGDSQTPSSDTEDSTITAMRA